MEVERLLFVEMARKRPTPGGAKGRDYNYFGTRTLYYLGTCDELSRIYTGTTVSPNYLSNLCGGSVKHRGTGRCPGIRFGSVGPEDEKAAQIRSGVDAGGFGFCGSLKDRKLRSDKTPQTVAIAFRAGGVTRMQPMHSPAVGFSATGACQPPCRHD